MITICSYLKRCVGYENWIYPFGFVSEMCCSAYQWFIPRKSCILVLISRIPLSGFCVLITICSYLKRCVGYENWIYPFGFISEMCCSEYQWFIPRKSCILVLISRIPLSDIEMDDLRTKSNHLGVYFIDIQ